MHAVESDLYSIAMASASPAYSAEDSLPSHPRDAETRVHNSVPPIILSLLREALEFEGTEAKVTSLFARYQHRGGLIPYLEELYHSHQSDTGAADGLQNLLKEIRQATAGLWHQRAFFLDLDDVTDINSFAASTDGKVLYAIVEQSSRKKSVVNLQTGQAISPGPNAATKIKALSVRADGGAAYAVMAQIWGIAAISYVCDLFTGQQVTLQRGGGSIESMVDPGMSADGSAWFAGATIVRDGAHHGAVVDLNELTVVSPPAGDGEIMTALGSPVVSANGRTAYAIVEVLKGRDKTDRLLDLKSKEFVRLDPSHGDEMSVLSVAVAANGNVAFAAIRMKQGPNNTGGYLNPISGKLVSLVVDNGKIMSLQQALISADGGKAFGAVLISEGEARRWEFFDLMSGRAVAFKMAGVIKEVQESAINHDGTRAFAIGKVRVGDEESWQVLNLITGEPLVLDPSEGQITRALALRVAEHGSAAFAQVRVLKGTERLTQILNLNTGHLVKIGEGGSTQAKPPVLSADGEAAFTVAYVDGQRRIIDLLSEKRLTFTGEIVASSDPVAYGNFVVCAVTAEEGGKRKAAILDLAGNLPARKHKP